MRRSWWMVPVLGVTVPLLMLGIDHVLFRGSSVQRIVALGSEPLAFRVLAALYSGVTEELIYRVVIATLFAWGAYRPLSRFMEEPKTLAQWLGIVVGALLFGLAHVGNLPAVEHPYLRAITLNGVAGLILGWLYWWKGLEIAILTHVTAIAVLYMVVPLFL